MACRIEMIAMHVHGHEADIDSFFESVEKAMEKITDEAEHLWPGLEFIEADEDIFAPWEPHD